MISALVCGDGSFGLQHEACAAGRGHSICWPYAVRWPATRKPRSLPSQADDIGFLDSIYARERFGSAWLGPNSAKGSNMVALRRWKSIPKGTEIRVCVNGDFAIDSTKLKAL